MISSVKGSVLNFLDGKVRVEIYLGDDVKYLNIPEEHIPAGYFYGMPVLLNVRDKKVVIENRKPDALTKEEQGFLDNLKF